MLSQISVDWRDCLDIALVTLIFYLLIQRLRSSRALTVLIGLIFLTGLYIASSNLGLYTLSWLLEHIFGSLVLLIVVIFQPDIRQALSAIGVVRFTRRGSLDTDAAEEILAACTDMARHRVGALIVIEQRTPLGDIITREGQKIDAPVTRQLLRNIFHPGAPMHDGAVIISHGRIMAAGCILPLAVAKGQDFGTRHRAAMGITQDSDAMVVVVSEERGEISLASRGQLRQSLDSATLRRVLHEGL